MKRRKLCRGLGFCMMILLMLTLLPLTAVAVQATYSFSSLYKQSIYYSNFSDLVLTGDQATDVISVATTQLGYHEGNSDSDFAGSNLYGTKNFVEYNRLYGMLDNNEGNGVSYGYYWCASFVNWCLRQTGVDEDISGSFVSCMSWVDWSIDHSIYKARNSGYTPVTGDLIFFKDADSTRVATHVGLVRYVEGNTVYTIEGNSAGAVNMRSYSLDDTYIAGYATPSYEKSTQLSLDFSGNTDIAGYYIVSVDGANVRQGADVSSTALTYLSKGNTVEIDRIENGWGHCTYNGTDAWISMSVLYLIGGKISTVNYDMNGGEGEIESQTKMYNEICYLSDITPVRQGYDFIGWSEAANNTTTQYIESSQYVKNGDTTLYALWEEIVLIPQLSELPESLIDEALVENVSENQGNQGAQSKDTGNVIDDITPEELDTGKKLSTAASDIITALMLISMPITSMTFAFIKHRK